VHRHSKYHEAQRRLQRPPDFTGRQLNHFYQVVLRHGLPGFLLGVLLLITSADLLMAPLNRFLAAPEPYVLGAGVILPLARCITSPCAGRLPGASSLFLAAWG
jgi:hypothetical protein